MKIELKKQVIFLLLNYLFLTLLFLLFLNGCSYIPEVTARVELNTCGEMNVSTNQGTIQAVYPYLEITIDDGNIKLSSSSVCFGLYIFDAYRDTLYHNNFKVIGQNKIELINILK